MYHQTHSKSTDPPSKQHQSINQTKNTCTFCDQHLCQLKHSPSNTNFLIYFSLHEQGVIMNRRTLVIILIFAVVLVSGILAAYVSSFGYKPSDNQAIWGAFGDYFGGILNPLFALFAFIALLWSLHLQSQQLAEIRLDKQGEEILQVIKDIDSKITELLKMPTGTSTIAQIISESERVYKTKEKSESYSRFLRHAKEPGSNTEALVMDMKAQVSTMHAFLLLHPKTHNGRYTPLIEYYTSKTARIVVVLDIAVGIPSDTKSFFDNFHPDLQHG
jgi:uncharacterized membrane protein